MHTFHIDAYTHTRVHIRDEILQNTICRMAMVSCSKLEVFALKQEKEEAQGAEDEHRECIDSFKMFVSYGKYNGRR